MAKRRSPLSDNHQNIEKNSKKKKRNKNNDNNKSKQEGPPPIPVTLLSGFLGSGKTTLMRHILTCARHGLKIAVIVNDMAELNIDGQTIKSDALATTTKVKPEVVTLQNGCICCTLRGDLIREIYKIQQLGRFDYVLIESTGIAEPQQVAESFCVDPETMELAATELLIGSDDNDQNITGKMLLNAANLDTCVTVVDALHFPKYMFSLNRFKELFDDGYSASNSANEAEGGKSISQLMVEQVEFANVIVLNKIDMVSEKELNTSCAIIKLLNPKAKVITCGYGNIDVNEILNTGLFDLAQASESPGWLLSLKQHGVSGAPGGGEADEYGVSSFVYKNRSPFHPYRLHKFLSQFFCFADQWSASSQQSRMNNKTNEERQALDQKYGRILRSKGNCWLAGRDRHIYDWAQTGQIIALQPGQPWFCTLPAQEWGNGLSREDMETIEDTLYKEEQDGKKIPHDFGDRQSAVVVIGTDLKQDAIIKALNDCCLSEEELKAHTTDLPHGSYEDPLHPNLVVECDGIRSLFLVARHGQDQHFHVPSGSSFTIQNVSLLTHFVNDGGYMVRVWLDKTDVTKRGILLATLRSNCSPEQHAMSMTILPCDVNGGEMDCNRRLRIEVVSSNHRDDDLMQLCEVHVAGKVEPLPFSEEDVDEKEAMTDEDSEDGQGAEEEACDSQ